MEQSSSMSALEIAGTATAAAAAIGGLMVVRSRRQSRTRSKLEDYVPVRDLEKRAQPAAERGRELASTASERFAQQAPELAEQISEAVRQSREAGLEQYHRQVPKDVQKAIKKRRISDKDKKALLNTLRSSVILPAAELVSKAQRSLGESGPDRKHAQRTAGDASSIARERASHLQSDVAARMRDTVIPGVRHGSEVAGGRLGKSLEQLRSRAEDSRSGGRLGSKDGVSQRAGAARGYVEETGQAARNKASRAAQGTSQAAKDTTATLGWLALASAIVYFAFLSPERREQVKSTVCGALEQIRLLALDFRGYEPEA